MKNNAAADFSQRLKALLRLLDLNANEAAEKIGTPNAKLYRLLKGDVNPSYSTIQELIAAFPKVNVNYLLTGELPIVQGNGAEIAGTETSVLYLPVLTLPTDSTSKTYPVLLHDRLEQDMAGCVVFNVPDNAMAPRIALGAVLVAREVPVTNWDYLNSAPVIISYRNVLAVRRIRENELPTKGYLTLYADSQDAGFVRVKREDIKSIWHELEIIGGRID